MNVITAYLDTMFAAYPPSPRMTEARSELHAMMEDAYTSHLDAGMSENEAVGRVITEFGNLDELAPQLGISGDIASVPPAAPSPEGPTALAPVTLDEAEAYLAARRETQPALAWAQVLFILSPAVLIVLSTLSAAGAIGIAVNPAVLIGTVVLLACVAGAVTILVRRRQRLAPFARLAEGDAPRSGAVDRWAGALAADAAPRRTTAFQIAVALWIVALVPILAVSLLASPETSRTWIGIAVAAMLGMFAVGTFVLLRKDADAATAAVLLRSRRAM
jgi:hypothetical protein